MFIAGVISSHYNVGIGKPLFSRASHRQEETFLETQLPREPPMYMATQNKLGVLLWRRKGAEASIFYTAHGVLFLRHRPDNISLPAEKPFNGSHYSHTKAHISYVSIQRPSRDAPPPTFPAFLQLPPILQSYKTACTYANKPRPSFFHLFLGFWLCLENTLLLSAHSAPLGKSCINITCSQESCLGPVVCPWHFVLSPMVSGCVQMTRSLSPEPCALRGRSSCLL